MWWRKYISCNTIWTGAYVPSEIVSHSILEVCNKKFLSVPIGTPISIAQQGKNRYETFIKEINCNNKKKCEWVISYRISYKNKVIREITCPMNWNYESEEAVLKELSYANFRCVKVSDTLLFARKK